MSQKRGRPPLSDESPSTDVCIKMPGELYDRAYERASHERTTVPDVIRKALQKDLDAQPAD